jgi:tripartite-type tricarboxylate transporter receptor subunit TctC
MNRLFRTIRLALLGLALTASASAFAQYPNRPLTLVVPWGAGGGTDAVARFIASLMEKDLGQPVNVVNRTGGSGVVGHSAIASAAPDGYTIGMITVEITMMHHQKLTELDPTSYTPIALVNLDPAGFQVRADSPYKTMNDVIAAIKAAPPGKFKASGTGQGGIWHLALAGMLSDLKIDPATVPWVPSNGAAPGLQDLAAGGVEFVPCSLPEARSLIDAGKVRSLAVMDARRASLFPDVPTLKEATNSNWATGAWRGIAAPKGLPKDVQAKLEASVKKAYDSKEYKDFMAQRGFGTLWGNSEEFAKFMAKGDADMKAVMTAVGIAK